MPSPRPHAHSDFAGRPPPWMKFTFFAVCAVMVVVAVFGWEQWEDARRDYAAKQREFQAKSEQNAKLQRDTDSVANFLLKFDNDPAFRDRVARQKLQYVAPGEVIFRLDPPPHPAPAESDRPK